MGVAGSVQGIGQSDDSSQWMWIPLAGNNKFLGWPRVACLGLVCMFVFFQLVFSA
jgi:hypothetical protein